MKLIIHSHWTMCLLLIIGALAAGCHTSTERTFTGRIGNAGDYARGELATRDAESLQKERTPEQRVYIGIDLNHRLRFVFAHPEGLKGRQELQSTKSEPLAWLLANSGAKAGGESRLSSMVSSTNSTALYGAMSLRMREPGREDFDLAVNLRSDDPTPKIVQGKFETKRKRRTAVRAAAMMIATDAGVYNANRAHKSAPPVPPQPISSTREQVVRLFASKEEHRVMSIHLIPSAEEQSAGTERPDVSVHLNEWRARIWIFIPNSRPDSIERLAAVGIQPGEVWTEGASPPSKTYLMTDVGAEVDDVAVMLEDILLRGFGLESDTKVVFEMTQGPKGRYGCFSDGRAGGK